MYQLISSTLGTDTVVFAKCQPLFTFLSYMKTTALIPTVALSPNNEHWFNILNDNSDHIKDHPIGGILSVSIFLYFSEFQSWENSTKI